MGMPTCPATLFINSFAHFFALGAGFLSVCRRRFAGQAGQVYCRFSLRDLWQQQLKQQQQQQLMLALDQERRWHPFTVCAIKI